MKGTPQDFKYIAKRVTYACTCLYIEDQVRYASRLSIGHQ